MRVGLVLEQLLAPIPGGTGRYSHEVAAALARTAAAGDEVVGFIAWHRDVAPARIGGVRGPRRLRLPRRPLTAAWELGRGPDLGFGDVDLVHALTPLAPPRRSRPLVVTVHDTVPWSHPETLTERGVRWHRRMVTRALASADAVVTPSPAVARELTALAGGTPAAQLVCVPPGVTAGVVATAADDASRAARLRLPPRYLLSVATVEPRKGLDVAIAALAASHTELPLVVVGQPGWGGVDLDDLLRRSAVPANRVSALGRLDDADVGAVLRRAEVLVMPSRAEGFGLPVLEAMAAGVPVVASALPVLAELTDGAADLVPPGDPSALAAALDRVVGDPARRRRMVAAGRIRAAGFDWDRTGRELWALYRSVAAST